MVKHDLTSWSHLHTFFSSDVWEGQKHGCTNFNTSLILNQFPEFVVFLHKDFSFTVTLWDVGMFNKVKYLQIIHNHKPGPPAPKLPLVQFYNSRLSQELEARADHLGMLD